MFPSHQKLLSMSSQNVAKITETSACQLTHASHETSVGRVSELDGVGRTSS